MTAASRTPAWSARSWSPAPAPATRAASLAILCSARLRLPAIVFVGSGKIAYGKLAQALDYGALSPSRFVGDFDDALMRVREVSAPKLGIYLMNSVNPFRLEGQKAIMFRVLEALGWQVPDWIVVPGGNSATRRPLARPSKSCSTSD
jgi:threonine synthase